MGRSMLDAYLAAYRAEFARMIALGHSPAVARAAALRHAAHHLIVK